MDRFSIAIITCNREHFYKKCSSSINSEQIDHFLTINDGKQYSIDTYKIGMFLIQHDTNKNVACSKNDALKHFINHTKSDYFFILEDDIEILDNLVFQKYIDISKLSGIQHLNYAFHGYYNRDKNNNPLVKTKIMYTKDIGLNLCHNCLGAFSFYTRKCIEKVGYMDEKFINAMEHVEHTKRIIDADMHPPFWYFADINDSFKYIRDIKDNFEGSEIRKDKEQWQRNFTNACYYFKQLHGYFPTEMPQTEMTEVVSKLRKIKNGTLL